MKEYNLSVLFFQKLNAAENPEIGNEASAL